MCSSSSAASLVVVVKHRMELAAEADETEADGPRMFVAVLLARRVLRFLDTEDARAHDHRDSFHIIWRSS